MRSYHDTAQSVADPLDNARAMLSIENECIYGTQAHLLLSRGDGFIKYTIMKIITLLHASIFMVTT